MYYEIYINYVKEQKEYFEDMKLNKKFVFKHAHKIIKKSGLNFLQQQQFLVFCLYEGCNFCHKIFPSFSFIFY